MGLWQMRMMLKCEVDDLCVAVLIDMKYLTSHGVIPYLEHSDMDNTTA